ncbi:CRISPR-associated endonuclease Cas2 [Bifidobacterium aerophilum]|uniref:CRISPR-associated endoribonuclease Cas2 n=1 Tax=Bifidobacterium aerophilum TaxID=1798155 RepID=A0A6N9Z3D6_9BIFI|nr:CRISPR-associated endonuclease Cas2 [Bifidobacterium aerophilum]NEG89098.1 CRISPR-associated endonuclease Cas2 [Bifidobacterium aerophilum]
MKKDEDSGGMWCLVMFDLPVKTKQQRNAATDFRNMLLDMGYGMVQYSVYARYTPTQAGNRATVQMIKAALPAQGYVRVLHVSDHQWSSALRFSNSEQLDDAETPELFTLFLIVKICCKPQKTAPLKK